MSFFNNSHAGDQGAINMTTQSSSRNSSSQSVKRGRSGVGTYSGVTKNLRTISNSPTLQRITSAQSLSQPDLWETIDSIVGPGHEKACDGEKRKPRAKVRWEGLQMFGWVDGAWKPAAYHIAVREKLILRDAQQPGAPVWRRGDSIDYTSYSPMTRDWTKDPHSIKDRQGRQVLMMSRPKDWSSKSRTGPLMYEGLVILDINNRPITDFPGAPLALKSTEDPWFLEGLRRCFGMTVWDLRYRMIPVRNSPNGPMWLQGYADFTNRLMSWRKTHNKDNPNDIICIWHPREKKGLVDHDEEVESSQQAEEDEGQEEELIPPTPSRAFIEAASDPIRDPVPSSSTAHMSTAPEQTAWEGNQFHIPTFPGANQLSQTTNTVPPDSIYCPGYPSTFLHQNIYTTAAGPSRSVGPSFEADYLNQPNTQHVEQRWEGNHLNIPTFPGAEQFSQPTNIAPPEGIYSSGYPSTFAPQNVYDAAAYSSTFLPQNIYTTAAYAPTSSSQNIYTAPIYPCHFGNPNGYTSPNYNNTPIFTTPDFGNIPTFTNSVGMASPNIYAQSPPTNVAQHDDFGLYQPSRPTVWDQTPPTAPSQSTQPTTMASTSPVSPQENPPFAFSSSEADPFMGAGWSSDMAEDWL